MNTWLVILAVDREPIRGFIDGVVPAVYKPTSHAVWCMVKTDTKERAIEMAMESYGDELADGESLTPVSISRWCDTEVVE